MTAQDQPYIKTVTTSVKGPTRNYTLGQRTVICGDNGSGKSAITQSIELALTGGVSDVAGRDPRDRRIGDIFPHGAGGVGLLWSDGATSEYHYQNGKGTRSGRAAPLLGADVAAALAAGDDRLLLTLCEMVGHPLAATNPSAIKEAKANLTARREALEAAKAAATARVGSCPTCGAAAPRGDATVQQAHRSAIEALTGQVEGLAARLQQLTDADAQVHAANLSSARDRVAELAWQGSKYMPDGWGLSLSAHGPVRVQVSTGPARTPVAAPSGGQWAAALLALGCAVSENLAAPSVVILPDRGMSSRTVRSLLRAIMDTMPTTQVIVPTVVPEAVLIDSAAHWTVIAL